MFELKRPPITPGEILLEEFLKPHGLSQTELAHRLECDIKTVNRIVNARQTITAEMALKLGGFFRTTPDSGLICNAQSISMKQERKLFDCLYQ